MRKFEVNKDKKNLTPTEEQIRRQKKDFARLRHDYEKLTKRGKKPIYRDPKLLLLLVLVGIVLLLLFLEDL